VLEQGAAKAFTSRSGVGFRPGDIIVLYPTALGGGERVLPYSPSDDPEETVRSLEKGVKDALKTRDADFGHIMFLSGVREHLLRIPEELAESAEAADARRRDYGDVWLLRFVERADSSRIEEIELGMCAHDDVLEARRLQRADARRAHHAAMSRDVNLVGLKHP
jgi:hypothetical protein